MSRQIKIIWILSLVSVLFLIGVQAYWLYNQYEYVLNTWSEEIASEVAAAGEEEFQNRKNVAATSHSVLMMVKNDTSNLNYNIIIGTMMSALQVANENRPHLNSEGRPPVKQQMIFIDTRNHNDTSAVRIDTTKFYMNFRTDLTGDKLLKAAERAVANQTTPFSHAPFDSLLAAALSELRYSITDWPANENRENIPQWKREGNLFSPRLIVAYEYSPLENKGVFVEIDLPMQPVLHRMGIQLVVSIGLILLLIACLIFQLKTILKQKKINEIRESFVNTMIHELQRPVQTLKTFVSFLNDRQMRSDEKATEQVVRDSMFELDNLSAYLSKLKDMLRVDDEITSLRPAKFNLNKLIYQVIRLTHIPPCKEVNITTLFDDDNLYIEADPIHFANVLSNLIENAIKYSSDKVNIEISAGQEKHKIKIAVSDNGIGIPVAEQERIFTKFYRGSNIPDKNIPGIGLGLSYVKLIIEAHQGSINLKSQPGEGTVVTLNLPQWKRL